MEIIRGQYWQDEQAYLSFMESQKSNSAPSISKLDLLERDLEELARAIKAGEEKFTMTLRAGNDVVLKPGDSVLVGTGISSAFLEDYEQTVRIIDTLNSNSWLRVAPFLVSKTGLSYMDLKNFSQHALARKEMLNGVLMRTLPVDSSIYIQDVKDIATDTQIAHVAYGIEKGDELATLQIRKVK